MKTQIKPAPQAHTWEVREEKRDFGHAKCLVIRANGEKMAHVADLLGGKSNGVQLENDRLRARADLIANAVNAREELIERIKYLVQAHDEGMGLGARQLRVELARETLAKSQNQ